MTKLFDIYNENYFDKIKVAETIDPRYLSLMLHFRRFIKVAVIKRINFLIMFSIIACYSILPKNLLLDCA